MLAPAPVAAPAPVPVIAPVPVVPVPVEPAGELAPVAAPVPVCELVPVNVSMKNYKDIESHKPVVEPVVEPVWPCPAAAPVPC